MKTRTLARRAGQVQRITDFQALERKRRAEEEAAALDVKGAERRRQELFMSIHYPEGTDPLHRSLQAYGAPPSSYQRYEPDESDLGEAIEAFMNRRRRKT
jgi:hypothetical protein